MEARPRSLDLRPLANPGNIKNEKDIYKDVLDKLKWDMLFFYYQEGDVTHESLPAKMFPITFEEIRSGLVRGPERIVTIHSGIYGWRGDRHLHFVYHYDAHGVRADHNFITTVDHAGVRTNLKLKPKESAVVEKLPTTLSANTPVNLLVKRYDLQAVQISLNGKGRTELVLKDGDFEIKSGVAYRVKTDTSFEVSADENGILSFPVQLDGQLSVTIQPAK